MNVDCRRSVCVCVCGVQATFLHVVPPVILFFAKHPLVAKYDFSSVHTVFTGAAPVGAQVMEEAVAKINVPRFRQGTLVICMNYRL
jgi:4-coumarate--CoA ligase